MKPKLPTRKTLVNKLDALFSIAVRLRDKKRYSGICPLCCLRSIGCVFHWITRSKFSVRWDFSNATGTCASCNFENEYNPDKFRIWYLKTHGQEAYESLVYRSNQLSRFSRSDLMDKIEQIKRYLEDGRNHDGTHPQGTKESGGSLEGGEVRGDRWGDR